MNGSPMPLPVVDAGAARADAERLRRAARLAAMAADSVGATAPSQWYGGAADGFDHRRAELARHTDDVAQLAARAAAAVERYASSAPAPIARMRRAAADLEVGLRLRAVEYDSPRATALIDQAWADYRAAEREYRVAVEQAAEVLRAVPGQTSLVALGPGRHVGAGVRRFWDETVVGPVSLGWHLTTGMFTDPGAWWHTLSSSPGALLAMFCHPVRTVDQMVAGDDWRAGEWGAAVGTALSIAVPWRAGKALAPDGVRMRFARNMADPAAPRPRVQRLDDMLGGARMAAHEHYGLGHAVRRHVDVTDAYLADRLRHGTLLDEGHRGRPPANGMASAWTDLHTAEEWVTRTLRAHERELRAWAAGGEPALWLELRTEPAVGRIMTIAPDGSPTLIQPNLVRVMMKRQGQDIYIHTAYPDVIP